MAVLRATMIFSYTSESGRQAGWSESWYLGASILDAQVAANMNQLMLARVRMLPAPGLITGYRLTQINDAPFGTGNALRSLSFEDNIPGAYTNRDNTFQQDIPQMALQARVLSASTLNVKNYDIHGLPDGIVQGGKYIPTGAFTQGFVAFAGVLSQRQFQFRGLDLTQAKTGIASISDTGAFTLTGDNPVEVGQWLMMLRVKDITGKPVKGTFYVLTKPTARTGTLLNWTGQTVGQSGEVRRRNFVYLAVQQGSNTPLRATTRKVGRPSNAYRGRVSARR